MIKHNIHIVTCQAHPVLVKKANQMGGSFCFLNFLYPWPRVLSLPGAQGGFVGDPTSLARDNILDRLKAIWERICCSITYYMHVLLIPGPNHFNNIKLKAD